MHKNNRVVHQETRGHSTETQPSTGVPAPQEPALNISGLDTTALTRLRAHRRRLLQELGGRRIPDGAQEPPWHWVLNPQAEAEPPQLFDPHLPAEALETQGIEYLRLCRALMMRLAEPADNIVAQALTAFGPAFTAHVLASGGRIPHSVWENGEPDPVLHAILMQRSPGYRPGEHETTREELEKALAARSKRWARRALSPVREYELALACGAWLAIPEDDDYPRSLDDLGPAAPYGLWGKGERSKLRVLADHHHSSVALVGSRDATQYGQAVTAHLSSELAEHGCTIISGGAYGVDIAAHRAALGAGTGKLPTVALMAGGLDHFYPAQNTATLQVIARDALVLSEVSIGNTPTRWRFLERNRLIAALAAHTVVAEARWRSGALNTAHHALEIGRQVWAVPGQIDAPNSVGCNRLIRDAHAQILTEAQDLLEAGAGFDAEREDAAQDAGVQYPTDSLTEAQNRLWDSLAVTAYRTVDDIAVRVGLDARTVMLQLGALDRLGLAQSNGQGWRKVRFKTAA